MNAVLKAASNKALNEAFPEVDPEFKTFGNLILAQIRSTKQKSAGGILLHSETKETEKWNTQVAKVIQLGPLAFRNRDTLAGWPEGAWCKVGDFIRVPKYGGDRWEIKIPGPDEDKALFALFKDLDIMGQITGDPLAVIAFL